MADSLELVKRVVAVALTAYAIRWLFNRKSGPQSPKIHGDVKVYEIKWQLRAAAYLAAALFFGLAAVGLRDDFGRGRWLVDLLLLAAGLLGLWFGTGVVTSDQNGITKRFLWHSVSLRWNEITEVRLHKRDCGAIELRGNLRKLIVDSRFVAPLYLENEIAQRTKLEPLRD
jgi:hypothetical protein